MTDNNPKKEIVEHLPVLRAFAMSLTRDPTLADDMVQDTVEKAWRNFDSFTPGTNMRAWLFTILRNNFYSTVRKRQREVGDSEGVFTSQMSVKPDHDGHLRMEEFRRAFAQLTAEQREALVLVGASGFSYEEAADMCNVAVGTIKSRVSRGRDRLAEIMELDADNPLDMTDLQTMSVVSKRIG